MRPLPLALLPLALAACGGSTASDVPLVAYEGTLPVSVPARRLFNTLTVSASVNGAKARPILLDTGSPMTGMDPSSWPDAKLSSGLSSLASLTVGALTFTEVPAVALDECGTVCGPFDVTGVLGGNVLRSFALGLDYQGGAAIFGPTARPSGTQSSAITVGLAVAGGGTGTIADGSGQVLDVPPTRLLVHATIDGTPRTLFVDTGSSYTLLRASLFTSFVADGRTQITLGDSTATGASQGAIARSQTLSVGAGEASGSPVGSVPDAQVDDVANEVGSAVDGMLGGSFLRAYYAVVDYGAGQLSLYPYTVADPLADEFDRVGVFLAESGDGYVIGQAVGASEASEEELVGEPLVDVDGTVVAGLDPDEADRLLRGALGATHTLHLQRGAAIVAETLTVEDVLSLSP